MPRLLLETSEVSKEICLEFSSSLAIVLLTTKVCNVDLLITRRPGIKTVPKEHTVGAQ